MWNYQTIPIGKLWNIQCENNMILLIFFTLGSNNAIFFYIQEQYKGNVNVHALMLYIYIIFEIQGGLDVYHCSTQ